MRVTMLCLPTLVVHGGGKVSATASLPVNTPTIPAATITTPMLTTEPSGLSPLLASLADESEYRALATMYVRRADETVSCKH